MKRIPKLLSKTKLLRGYRCPKAIYLTIHQPELEPPITPDLQALFDQGNLVGETARRYRPGGTLVDCKPWEFGDALTKTRDLIADGTPIIYEAAFEYLGCYARADIIEYSTDTKRWSIYEVKSTTSVKQEHLDDVGLQTWIMARSGLPIEKIHVMHLNRECRFPDLENLFVTVDVTEPMREQYKSVAPRITALMDVLRQPVAPAYDIGPHCLEPTECPFIKYCWQHIPKPSIFDLPNIKERKWQLYQQGIISLDDERLTDLTELQQRMVHVTRSGEGYVDEIAVVNAIKEWPYPWVFLDFETINPAIPRYHNTGPYQQTPFQFSAHQLLNADAPLMHKEFLFTNQDDPRPQLITALLEACGTSGAIIAYYGKFEADRIRELAEFDPTRREALLGLIDRIVDPLPIFRTHVYDAAFLGSFSLKNVAPAILGEAQSYKGMQVANGGDAQRAFEAMLTTSDVEKKQELEQALKKYCEKDTLVMVELVKWMQNLNQKINSQNQ